MEAEERVYSVNIARIVTKKSPAIITCILGSCLGIILYDSRKKVGSLAHTMLPTIKDANKKRTINPAKYVDSAIEKQLKELNDKGVRKKDLTVRLVGGAKMFGGTGRSDVLNIGDRNAEQAIKTIEKIGIPITGKDLGKDFGRRVEFNLENGKVRVLKANKEIWKEL
ncbi:MAG: chemotaxis protein CheD [Candidatus Hodarchaeales archaeon]